MRHLEQHLDATNQCLDDLEAAEVPDPSTFVTSQAIDTILTDFFFNNGIYQPSFSFGC